MAARRARYGAIAGHDLLDGRHLRRQPFVAGYLLDHVFHWFTFRWVQTSNKPRDPIPRMSYSRQLPGGPR